MNKLEQMLRGEEWNLYELAVMTDAGAEFYRAQPSNMCQNSYSVAKAFTMVAVGMLCDAGIPGGGNVAVTLITMSFRGPLGPWESPGERFVSAQQLCGW